jgi:hypothetical protein
MSFSIILYIVFRVRNLFLGYYLPYRHSVPLWEMENDYYLHNFHVMNARNATTFMKTHERAFGNNWVDEEEVESPMKLHSHDPGQDFAVSSKSQCFSDEKGSRLESERVARVRRRCNKQNLVLSSWWKIALQANLEEKMLLRFGRTHEENVLPGRFERVYQPEKLTQFDRVFSRTWETPVRRSHAAQHAEGVDGDDVSEFARLFFLDLSLKNHKEKLFTEESRLQRLSLSDFVAAYKFDHRSESNMKLFVEFFDREAANVGNIGQVDCEQMTIVPEKYREYCAPISRSFHLHTPQQIKEFKEALRNLSLSVDDVAGISEVRNFHFLSYYVATFKLTLFLQCCLSFFAVCSIKPSRRNNNGWGIPRSPQGCFCSRSCNRST